MFKKIISTICVVAIAATFAFQAVACKKEEQKVSSHEVWGTFATSKVGQNSSENGNFVKTAAKFDVQMMKNEKEGDQIIVTAAEDISSFYLTSSDLKSSNGKIFPAKNITVYQEKYIQIKQKQDFNGVYAIGEYVPDMLLPMDIAKEYRENTVKKGNNQGIYVEFDSKGVEAGVYSGSFNLDTDGKITSVPVTVEVWDIEYEGTRDFQSCFVLYQTSLLRTEYDNSEEVVNKYVDFFLDYKINTYVHNRKRNNWQMNDGYKLYGEEWLNSIKRLKGKENFNSVFIPYQFQPGYTAYVGGNPTDAAKDCAAYIVNLAKICTPEFNYMKYAYFYPFEIDEADIEASGSRASNAERLLREGGEVDQTLGYAVGLLRNDEEFAAMTAAYGNDFTNEVIAAIYNLPTLFTNVTFKSDWVDSYTAAAFCPYLSLFGDGVASDRYNSAASKSNRGIWAYTCVGPTYPYPTFHLDDYNLGTRISGWMEKKYNINGYLYWSTTEDFYHEEWYKYLNQYEDPTRWKGADGDGYLVYPGKYYGSETPFPSLRLVAYRDSQDDYDMLCVYEKLLNELYEKYGLGTLDFDAYTEELYSELFTGTVYDLDDSKLFDVRKELAERIEVLKGEEGLLTVLDYAKGKRTLNVYSAESTITVDGIPVSGKAIGNKGYSCSVLLGSDATSVKIVAGSTTANYSFGAVKPIDMSTGAASEKSTFSLTNGEAKVRFNPVLLGSGIDDFKTINFTPSLTFDVGSAGIKTDALCFTVKNGGENAEVYVRVIAGNMNYEVGSMYLTAGEKRNVRFNLNGIAAENGAKVVFYVKNVTVEKNEYVLCPDRAMTIAELRFESAKEKRA